MSMTVEQRDVLKEMWGVVESYRSLKVGRVKRLQRMVKETFEVEIDIDPAIAAIRSRRGDRIYAELERLQGIVRRLEKKVT